MNVFSDDNIQTWSVTFDCIQPADTNKSTSEENHFKLVMERVAGDDQWYVKIIGEVALDKTDLDNLVKELDPIATLLGWKEITEVDPN